MEKKPLVVALEELTNICALVEDGQDVPPESFQLAKDDFSKAVERRIWLIKNLESVMAQHKETIFYCFLQGQALLQ